MNRRTLLTVPLLAASAVVLGASSCEPDADVEVEDCDAEDRRNREAECGYPRGSRTPGASTTKPKTSKTGKARR